MKKIMITMFVCVMIMGFSTLVEARDKKHYNRDNYGYNDRNDYRDHNRYDNNYRDNNRKHNDRNYRYDSGHSRYTNRRSSVYINLGYSYNSDYYGRGSRHIMKEIRNNERKIQKLENKLWKLERKMDRGGRYYYRYQDEIRSLRWEIQRLRERNEHLWRIIR